MFKSYHDDIRYPALGTKGMSIGSDVAPRAILDITGNNSTGMFNAGLGTRTISGTQSFALAPAGTVTVSGNESGMIGSCSSVTVSGNRTLVMGLDNTLAIGTVSTSSILSIMGGSVGIGTTDNPLTVRAANAIIDAQSTADSQTIGLRAGYQNHATLAGFFRYTTGDAQLWIDNEFTGNNAVYSDINFRNKANGGSTLITRLKIKGSTGYVGIGTNGPDQLLHIYKATAGSVTASSDAQLVVENSAIAAINLLSGSSSHGQILFGDAADNDDGQFGYDQSNREFYWKTAGSGNKALKVYANDNVTVEYGKVGIGSQSPDTALFIRGPFDGSASYAATNPNKGITLCSTGNGSNYGDGYQWGLVFAGGNNAGPTNEYPVAAVMARGDGVSSYVGGELSFQTKTASESNLSQKMVIDKDGKVGIPGLVVPMPTLPSPRILILSVNALAAVFSSLKRRSQEPLSFALLIAAI